MPVTTTLLVPELFIGLTSWCSTRFDEALINFYHKSRLFASVVSVLTDWKLEQYNSWVVDGQTESKKIVC